MALETIVFQQDPYSNGFRDYYNMLGLGEHFNSEALHKTIEQGWSQESWDSPPSSMAQSVKEWEAANDSSPEIHAGDDQLRVREWSRAVSRADEPCRRKRRRTKSFKNEEEIENQRMNHITVERNRRKQMNHYLAVLRSLMPPSYAQRVIVHWQGVKNSQIALNESDQASIVGGAINFVKELEQLLQFLEAHKQVKQQQAECCHSHLFHNFFTFPQFSICPTRNNNDSAFNNGMVEQRSNIADIEVTMVETYANIKVLSSKQPKQLFKMVMGFHSMSLTILHLNITTANHMVLYSFSVKVEENCQLTTVNDIATAVHEILGMIRKEAISI